MFEQLQTSELPRPLKVQDHHCLVLLAPVGDDMHARG